MTVSEYEVICPQCGGDDIKVDIHPEPYHPGAVGRIEALCADCGRTVTAYIPSAGSLQEPADVTCGTGAYVIVTARKTYYGALESEWSELHDSYFKEVFASDEVVCGRVTRWDDKSASVVTMYSHGDLEAMIKVSKEIAGAST